MKDLYSSFVELSLQQCAKSDYSNKQKVKAHNTASKKLKLLQTEMEKNDSKELLCMLLSHEDDRVKINAASMCLQMNIIVDKAVYTLEKIVVFSDDSTMSFAAKMILQSISKQS